MALKIFCGSHRQTVRPNTTLPFSFVLMLIGAALIPMTAKAQVNSWDNPQSGTWNWATAANWSLGLAPSVSQSAIFITNAVSSLAGSHFRTVTVDSTTASQPATMTVSNVTVSATGSGVNGNHNSLFLNNAGLATPLHVLSSCAISTNGAMTVTNSILQVDSFFGIEGIDTFSIDGTLTLQTDGSVAAIGEAVGFTRPGTLNLSGGSNFAYRVDIGYSGGSAGTVSVSGGILEVPFTNASPAGIFIGNGNGFGSLVQSGGTVETGGESVGVGEAGTLTVAGGTHIVNNPGLIIGSSSSSAGTVWVTGGQLLANAGITLGGVSGALTQSNGVVQTLADYVGEFSLGTLTVAGGIHVVGSGGLHVGYTDGSPGMGTVWLTGGQLVVTDNYTGTIIGEFSTGRMIVSNGIWQASNVVVAPSDGADGTLTVAGGASSVYINMTVGDCPSDVAGVVWVKGGDMFVTNATHDAVLDVRNGWIVLTAGHLTVDKLVMTNDCGMFIRAGGSLTVGSLLLDPNLDADGDGLPNGWEQAHGLDPLSSIGNDGADGDPDGDGLSNLEEYQLGTDPMDPSSPYHITAIQRQGNDVLVTWATVNGKTNVIQSTHGTVNGSYSNNFIDLSPQIIAPGCFCVASTNYLDVGGATNTSARYYRVRVVP